MNIRKYNEMVFLTEKAIDFNLNIFLFEKRHIN